MRKLQVNGMLLGLRLAKSIFTSDGRILLGSGVELKESYIERLKAVGITEVYIEDDISSGINISDVICEQTRLEAKSLVKKLMNNYPAVKRIELDKVMELVEKIIDELLTNRDVVISLSDIRTVDDYTFEHSVNVCIISLIIGKSMGFSMHRLKDLGVGAILHDIGKLRVPEQILKKSSQLTVEEFEEVKKHTIYGYEILKKNKNISLISAFIALGHHERFDGTGVVLNTHERGLVVSINDKTPEKPVIRIITDCNNERLEEFYEMDLSERDDLYVIDCCEL